MDEKSLKAFLERFMDNQVSAAEHQEFLDWLSSLPQKEVKEILNSCSTIFQHHTPVSEPHYENLILAIEDKLDVADQRMIKPAGRPWYRIGYISAAAVALLGGMFFLYFSSSKSVKKQLDVKKYTKIVPGSNRAVLTLADGKQIVLSGAINGQLVKQHDFVVHKVKEGELIYSSNTSQKSAALQYNTLVTPKGGQYRITLPDGTRVWLNAASTLKFPAVFRGRERRLELDGEAYFEVAKNKIMPFIVNVNHTEVKVLGTHFNIMGYADEPATRTTLLEGAVRISNVSQSRDIVPGQQAVVQRQINILSVDTAQAVGWKNGNFTFAHEKIEVVMKKISRWYDVDIHYEGKPTDEEFVGVIPRSKELKDVLHKLELTGLLKFKIKERSVIIMN